MTVKPKSERAPTAPTLAQEYQRPQRGNRRVLLAGGLSDRQITALRKAEVPAGFADLNAELENWNP
jgi:hypothetical protein